MALQGKSRCHILSPPSPALLVTQPAPRTPFLSHRPPGRRQMSPQEIPRDPFPRLSSRSCLTIRTRVSPQPPSTTRPHPGESSAAVPACPSPLSLHPSLLVQGSVMLTWRPWAGQNGPTAPALSCSGFLWGGEGLEGRSQGPSACRVYTTGLTLNPDLPVPKPSLFTVYILSLPDCGVGGVVRKFRTGVGWSNGRQSTCPRPITGPEEPLVLLWGQPPKRPRRGRGRAGGLKL